MAHARQEISGAELKPPRTGVVADDLTGAGDTALAFWDVGREVWILPEIDEQSRTPAQFQAIAANTESRHMSAEVAAQRVDQALRVLARSGCNRFYKKIDSTLRGNLGAEILQALRTLDFELALVAPAFPAAGRMTVGGYQLVDGVPVSASAYARDPLAPVTQSHLPTLLSQETGLECGHVGLNAVMAGPEAIAGAIVKAVAGRTRILVADAARHEDLQAIARAIALTPYRVLSVGSAGLAGATKPPRIDAGHRGVELIIGKQAPVLTLSGSLNPTTIRQVREASKRARLVTVDVQSLLLTEGREQERLIRQVLPMLLARQDVVLATGTSETDLTQGRALGRTLGMLQTGTQLATALGEVVARLVAEVPLSGLVLAGGETSLGACRALGGAPLKVLDELLPAIPLCRLETPSGPLRVATKSGGFGGPDALIQLADRLKRADAS